MEEGSRSTWYVDDVDTAVEAMSEEGMESSASVQNTDAAATAADAGQEEEREDRKNVHFKLTDKEGKDLIIFQEKTTLF